MYGLDIYIHVYVYCYIDNCSKLLTCTLGQCLSQDLETVSLKLAVVKFLGVQNFKGGLNILRFQP